MHLRHRSLSAIALTAALVLPACASGPSTGDVAAPQETRSQPSPPASATPPADVTPAVPESTTSPPDITTQANSAPAPTWTDVPETHGLDPARVHIPAIGVDAEVIDLGLDQRGHLEVPTDFSQTGWFDLGARPGEHGAAVIAGHIDNDTGPAVFYRLRELEPGDQVVVEDPDGQTVTFAIETIQQYPKDDFPTEDVYGFTPYPSLRLITCGGLFNADTQSYESNTIAFARRIPPDPA